MRGADPREYALDEIWTINLAIDVLAMLNIVDGVSSNANDTVANCVREFDWAVQRLGQLWRTQLKKAGDGPPVFRQLRAGVPHRTPNPTR